MNKKAFVKALQKSGLYFDHHGSRHDIYIHRPTGKKLTIPRHSEFSNIFLKEVSLLQKSVTFAQALAVSQAKPYETCIFKRLLLQN